ncbi:hypothetical protein AB6A40_005060 [Gnathostoma spinigerum]|uniref:Uncharacterized protein n=1 Tax=Gnathostoma spinigerum TaxID=75299 RepID=A0ABD6EFB6_9BILA
MSVPGIVRVEDLERGFQRENNSSSLSSAATSSLTGVSGMNGQLPISLVDSRTLSGTQPHMVLSQMSKCSPLVDPNQQAHLMTKLTRFARQQEFGSHQSFPEAAVQNLIRSQYEAALMQAFNSGHRPVNPVGQPLQPNDLHSNAMRSMLASMLPTGPAHSAPNISANVHSAPVINTPRATLSSNVSNTFMPTSVMRQMTKAGVSLEEKQKRSVVGTHCTANGFNCNEERTHCTEDHISAAQKPSSSEVMNGDSTGLHSPAAASAAASTAFSNGNAGMDFMAKLALQQQYTQVMTAMQGGLPIGAWRPPPQLANSIRAQALAAQFTQQQFALAVMRGDLAQAQAIRARFLAQQAAAASNMSVTTAGHAQNHPPIPLQQQHICPSTTAQLSEPSVQYQPFDSSSSMSSSFTGQSVLAASDANSFKYQNPLEKLLQSAGVPTSSGHESRAVPNFTSSSTNSGGIPSSIISRLPPSANCISLEELERQFATK